MTPFAPSQLPLDVSTRTRVKWDNIAIVLIGLVVACFAVVGILASGSTPSAPAADKPANDLALAAEAADETLVVDGSLTADDAQSLLDEARTFMSEARWDEAADRLSTVPEQFRTALGVEALEQQLAATRATHDQLRAELDAAVEARQWKQARQLLADLAKIAALDTQLLETQALVEQALAPKPKRAPTPAKPEAEKKSAAAVTGGGPAAAPARPANQSATTRPTTPPPAVGTTRPSNATGGGARPSGATAANTSGAAASSPTGTGTSGAAGGGTDMQLTPEQEQQLAAALAAVEAAQAA